MKKALIVLQVLGSMYLLSSCENNLDKLEVTEAKPVVLSDLTTKKIELDQVNFNNPAVTFSWSTADYGQQTPVSYSVEIAADQAFTKTKAITTISSQNAATLSVTELNAAAGDIGLPPFAWSTVYARITSSIGTNTGLPVKSNAISFQVFPYFNYPYKDYYMVGNATPADWNNNNNNPPLFRSSSNSKEYNYVGYFGTGEFKVLEVKGLWQPQWGTNDGAKIDVNPGTGSDPGTFPKNNSAISTSGYYKFTINYSSNSFSFTPYSMTGAQNYSSIAIEGSASATSKTMTQSKDSHIWFANTLRLKQGTLNFKNNLGETWGSTTDFSGKATKNGGNIPVVVEDDYDVWYNDLTGDYILIPQNL